MDNGKKGRTVDSVSDGGDHWIPAAKAAISIHELTKEYEGKRAVDGISLEVRQGEIFGLLGPNGAGKTTTLECLTGLRRPTSGSVEVLGHDPTEAGEELRRLVAVQPQEANLFAQLTVRETVELWSSFYPSSDDVDDLLERVGLTEAAFRRVKALSGGQARRLLLAVAIVGRPDVLVLDEPAAGLDPQAKELLWAVVRKHRQSGGTVLLTTHDMNEAAELCDRVAVLVDGRVAACDTPARLVSALTTTSVVTFTTDAGTNLDEIRAVPSVISLEAQPEHAGQVAVRVRTTDSDETLRRIAAEPQWTASGLAIIRGGLDEVFRSLAKGVGTAEREYEGGDK
ncbi:ABC transporter ATP-binding protein [Streptomyces sp. NPDC057579]|uniref:ABC transporter ATP-binding protein n=1 Tax=Streptomyces sp. NPDC057579 TaxID=3346172 RepID=UPI00369204E8